MKEKSGLVHETIDLLLNFYVFTGSMHISSFRGKFILAWIWFCWDHRVIIPYTTDKPVSTECDRNSVIRVAHWLSSTNIIQHWWPREWWLYTIASLLLHHSNHHVQVEVCSLITQPECCQPRRQLACMLQVSHFCHQMHDNGWIPGLSSLITWHYSEFRVRLLNGRVVLGVARPLFFEKSGLATRN